MPQIHLGHLHPPEFHGTFCSCTRFSLRSISCMSPKPVSSMPIISIYCLSYFTFGICSVLFQLMSCLKIDSIPVKHCIPFSQMSTLELLESTFQFCLIVPSSDPAMTGITALDSQQRKGSSHKITRVCST